MTSAPRVRTACVPSRSAGAMAYVPSSMLSSRTFSRLGSPTSSRGYNRDMCRNIKTLANFEPPATEDEIRASALQFVRKLSGSARPSKANEAVFNQAVEDVTEAAQRLISSLITSAPPRNRDVEAQKAQEFEPLRSEPRFKAVVAGKRRRG